MVVGLQVGIFGKIREREKRFEGLQGDPQKVEKISHTRKNVWMKKGAYN